MEKVENSQVKSKRDQFKERMKGRYPDRDFDDERRGGGRGRGREPRRISRRTRYGRPRSRHPGVPDASLVPLKVDPDAS